MAEYTKAMKKKAVKAKPAVVAVETTCLSGNRRRCLLDTGEIVTVVVPEDIFMGVYAPLIRSRTELNVLQKEILDKRLDDIPLEGVLC
jgi:hypothetical protein